METNAKESYLTRVIDEVIKDGCEPALKYFGLGAGSYLISLGAITKESDEGITFRKVALSDSSKVLERGQTPKGILEDEARRLGIYGKKLTLIVGHDSSNDEIVRRGKAA